MGPRFQIFRIHGDMQVIDLTGRDPHIRKDPDPFPLVFHHFPPQDLYPLHDSSPLLVDQGQGMGTRRRCFWQEVFGSGDLLAECLQIADGTVVQIHLHGPGQR